MPIRTIPNTDLRYYLLCWDKKGNERDDDPDSPTGLLSDSVWAALDQARDEGRPITDVYLTCHGWMKDVPSAVKDYDDWFRAMAECTADREELLARRPGYRSMIFGLHWRSKPFGNENLSRKAFGFAAEEDPVDGLVDDAADSLADTPKAREALRTIVETTLEGVAPDQMPLEVEDAYQVLWEESGLSAEGPAAPPGADGARFDASESYRAIGEEVEERTGIRPSDLLFAPLRGLSYWKMKHRARKIGESGGARLLREIQRRGGDGVRIHLMGHSFGCIVVSSMIGGKDACEPLVRPVDTVFLAQGAFSFWSFSSSIPVAPGKAGYFHGIVRDGKIAGPLVSTQSETDYAVGRLYPSATGVTRSVDFAPGDDLPRYGALGAFGFRGEGIDPVDLEILPLDGEYDFEPGRIYNLESSSTISEVNDPFAGSHGDIARPEVGHAYWQAVLSGLR